jgi:hypothetical protein
VTFRDAVNRISPRERRTMAAALSLVLVAWLATRGIPRAVRGYADLRARTTLTLASAARGREALLSAPAERETLAVQVRQLVALAPRLLSGTNASEAQAELAGLIGGSAALRHVRVIEQEARPDSAVSVFRRVTLRVSAEGDIGAIAGWMADLEEGVRLIRIRSLEVMASEPASPPTQAERLRAELVIDGWAQRRADNR